MGKGEGSGLRAQLTGIPLFCCRAFDTEGVLRDVPAAENSGEWPAKKVIESYHVEEKVMRLLTCGEFVCQLQALCCCCCCWVRCTGGITE